ILENLMVNCILARLIGIVNRRGMVLKHGAFAVPFLTPAALLGCCRPSPVCRVRGRSQRYGRGRERRAHGQGEGVGREPVGAIGGSAVVPTAVAWYDRRSSFSAKFFAAEGVTWDGRRLSSFRLALRSSACSAQELSAPRRRPPASSRGGC